MNILDILFSSDLVIGLTIQSIMIILGIFVFEFLHLRLQNTTLEFFWDNIGMPLYRAFVIVVFVIISYPTIFGLTDVPSMFDLIQAGDSKIISIVNILFVLGFIFPFLPVLGKHTSLVLLLQSLICCMFVFSWLADYLDIHTIHYFPEFHIAILILILAVGASYLASYLALHFGEKLDKRFNLDGCDQLIGTSLGLLIQAPIILLYSTSLGKQLV